jgi:hypothetical protein
MESKFHSNSFLKRRQQETNRSAVSIVVFRSFDSYIRGHPGVFTPPTSRYY